VQVSLREWLRGLLQRLHLQSLQATASGVAVSPVRQPQQQQQQQQQQEEQEEEEGQGARLE
jgi:hypothetical protein